MLTIHMCRVRPEEDSDISLPRYMTQYSSGMDLCAAVKEPVVLSHGEIALIPTGFAVAIPVGFEAQIRPRSGLALKHGISLINSPGTIDADYRGEIGLAVINLGGNPYTIRRGARIAQMVIQKVYQMEPREVSTIDETPRNTGGFGHTGI